MKNQINLKNPCNVSWDSLSGKGCERFCTACQNSVVDLTNKSNAEIIDLVMNKNGKLCGRISKNQVNKIILQNRNNKGFIKTFFVFLFCFANVYESEGTLNLFRKNENELTKSTFDGDYIQSAALDKFNQVPLIRLTGKVISSDESEPLKGVIVFIKGTPFKTETDEEGNFALELEKKELRKSQIILVFSFIGFEEKEIELKRESNIEINVSLNPDFTPLGEIQVPLHQRIWWSIKYPFMKKKA